MRVAMMKKFGKTLSLTLLLALSILSLSEPLSTAQATKSISFEHNMIPNTSIYLNNSRFVFEWETNYMEIGLFTCGKGFEYEFEIETEKTKLKIKTDEIEYEAEVESSVLIEKFESNITWGIRLWEIPPSISTYLDFIKFKILNANFGTSEIKLLEIESPDEPYIATRINLPDNLLLSYDDLFAYNLTVFSSELECKVEGLSGKSTWNLDPITYSSGVITVTGYSEGSECSYLDIWNADQSGGWGVFHNHLNQNVQFQQDCSIYFGDDLGTPSWFKDTKKQIFVTIVPASNIIYWVKENAHFTLGNLKDATDKVGGDGCTIHWNVTGNRWLIYGGGVDQDRDINLYGSTFSVDSGSKYVGFANGTVIYNCMFLDRVNPSYCANVDLNDCFMVGVSYGMYESSGTINEIKVLNSYYGLLMRSGTVNNIYIRNSIYANFRIYNPTSDMYLINPDVDTWSFSWTTTNYEVYRRYTFDLTVTDSLDTAIQNANVTITYEGQGGGTVGTWLTDSDGQIPQQTLSRSFYNQTGDDTEYPYYPFQVTITNDGYNTYTQKWTPTEKEHRRIALAQNTQPGWTLAFVFVALLICVPLGLIFFIGRKR